MTEQQHATDDRPHMVGHVHLKVRDVERSIDFYTEVLGLGVTERYGRFAFLSYGTRHHDVAVQEVEADPSGHESGVGLYHAAFEVDSTDALAAVFDRLREGYVRVSPVDHGISKALYFDDPDGNGIEVYYDTREENDQQEWGGRNERFDPHSL
jgi:catechol 2,3-dioxygenase